MSADPIYGGLNPEQKKAVEHTQGPLLILAGAGSGKTRALTHRIARLIQDGVPPWQILAVTFTNKASKEMKARIKNLLHISGADEVGGWHFNQGKMPVMGTFHSLCARILRRDIEHIGRDRTFVIYDADDQEKLMKEVLKTMNIEKEELKPKAALGYIGRFKCEAVNPKQAEVQATTPRMQQIVRAYGLYQKALRDANALDFDDLILEAVRLFVEVPEVLDRYQETWRYLHVDEYQDTNHAQYLFITLLAKKYRNLCVIGDPDQSIYSFRGADIRNILEFERDYKDASHIKLEQNYRSTQPILTASDKVISFNPNRPKKTMWTEKKEGEKIIVQEVRDEKLEAEEAIKSILEKQKQGVPLNEQVILYRTNAQSRLFEEACLRAALPYRIIGGVKFYARREVKDVLAYLHVIVNPFDTLSLLRILNVPGRKIGQTTIEKMQAYASVNSLTLWETLQNVANIPDLMESVRGRITDFAQMLEDFHARKHSLVVADLTKELLSKIDMEGWLKDDTEEGEIRWENVLELLSVMNKYSALDPETSLLSFLEEVALVSEVDKLTDVQDDAVTLMTLHLCKGLEFEHVIVAGCEEGIFPHSNSMFDKEQLEEERRIMYVGMTRAKRHLRLMFAQSRQLYGETKSNAPSRFLDDLPDEVTERRSDDILSAFAWAAGEGKEAVFKNVVHKKLEPFRQDSQDEFDVEFNQDISFDESEDKFTEGSRIEHPSFGQGTIISRRGDIAEVQFDSGGKKSFALSIAPLKAI